MTTTTLSFDAYNPGQGFTFNSAYALRFHPVYQPKGSETFGFLN
ncbi:MAG: hypothetical protein RLZZ298_1665 [Pseudomonadota bacterium]|jgi:hypothetical protein